MIVKRVNQWSANDKENVWELSGLFEGDIMPNSDSKIRNGLVDETMRWPNGSIPIYIKRDDFGKFFRFKYSHGDFFFLLKLIYSFKVILVLKYYPLG